QHSPDAVQVTQTPGTTSLTERSRPGPGPRRSCSTPSTRQRSRLRSLRTRRASHQLNLAQTEKSHLYACRGTISRPDRVVAGYLLDTTKGGAQASGGATRIPPFAWEAAVDRAPLWW